jgi:hypothetical protein
VTDLSAVDCIVIDIIDQLIVLHPEPIQNFVTNTFCKLFEGEIRVACSEFIDEYGVEIILGLQAFQNADDICQSIKLCKNPTCRLLPKYTEASSESVIRRTPRYSGRQLLEADNFAAYLKSGRKVLFCSTRFSVEIDLEHNSTAFPADCETNYGSCTRFEVEWYLQDL